MKTVFITGVSSGIGRAAAEELLRRGCFVYGSVRKPEDAPAGVSPLVFDVTDAAARQAALATVQRPLDVLVNNAGIAVAGPLMELTEADLRRQMEVNFFAPIALTREAFPHFAPGARVVMVSSVSGKSGYPFVGAYAASKHALEGASESLRRELMFRGMDVVLLCPGAIQTPIWNKYSLDAYANGAYGRELRKLDAKMREMAGQGLPVEQIGRLLADIVLVPKPRTRYTPVPDFWRWAATRFLPSRWVDAVIRRSVG
ncbi:MAG: SDR family oxidoreductase [Bryobacter sp.]